MENRAWRGIRLVSERIREANTEYIYTIGWHVPIGMFYLEEQVTYLDRKPIPETFGKIVGFAHRIKPLIQWIERKRSVEVEVDDPQLEANEQYEILDGKRLLEKYPKWKTEVSREEIIE
jgi:hypothetical protein